ncbi:MAG: hypothetical protein CVU18_02995 [Betaproteobacteria bacterium HGW-Betaproteobacteria-12]|nr:MAG: hypothetical protein CVU18_02995 [Betaproteobacteria bacterium HGW-Betaproteobacteria-12]
MSDEIESIGFVKYEGKRLETGSFDARKSAKALLGLDEAIRHFMAAQNPELRDVDFEIPVRIEKGSWVASIPSDVGTLIQLGMGIVATAYFTNAAKKMAERDFDGVGFKDAFRVSLQAIKWVARIGKHLGNLLQRRFENVKFADDNTLVGIPNERGEYLFVPKRYLDLYVGCSPKILDKLASNIDPTIVLSVGVIEGNVIDAEVITQDDKAIFTDDEEELTEEVLFPELVHGERVVLEGEVTRENKTSHSMGFKYQGHILTAYPDTGNIVPFKQMLFDRCRLVGVVDRIDEKGRIGAKRPKLIFSHLAPIQGANGDLFNA